MRPICLSVQDGQEGQGSICLPTFLSTCEGEGELELCVRAGLLHVVRVRARVRARAGVEARARVRGRAGARARVRVGLGSGSGLG